MINQIKKFLVYVGVIVAAALGGKTLQKPDYTPPSDPVKAVTMPILTEGVGYRLGSVTNQDGSDPTPEQLTMARESVAKDQALAKSDCYRQSMLTFSFDNTNGLSNQEIYNTFTTKPVTVNIQFFYGSFAQNHWSRTMGYDIGDGVVYANTYFIQTSDDLASLAMHEIAHDLGFHHSSAQDHSSVPYAQNTLFDKCNGKQ